MGQKKNLGTKWPRHENALAECADVVAATAAATALPPPPPLLPPSPPLPRVLILSKHKNELELAALYAPLIVVSEVLLYREKVHSIRRAWKKVQCQEHQSDAWRIDTWTMKMDYESMHSIYIHALAVIQSWYIQYLPVGSNLGRNWVYVTIAADSTRMTSLYPFSS